MAYLILATDGLEWDRRELLAPIVLGRSPDCDISVHDILLSRRHCRIIPSGNDWLLIDLASRNGTRLGEQVIEQCRLKHGNVIRIGKTKITFRDEVFAPSQQRTNRPAVPQAINREELLASTVAGMVVIQEVPDEQKPTTVMHRPTPRPRPMDPVSFESDEIYSMLEQIASSSWDSIYAVNAQPLRRQRELPQPKIAGQARPRPSRPPVSIDLQLRAADRAVAPIRQIPRQVPRQVPKPKPRKRFASIGRLISRVGMLRLF